MSASAASKSSVVIGTYRNLAKLVGRLPEKQQPRAWNDLREGYRKNANETCPEKIDKMIQEAGKKIAFLRIVTPKAAPSASSATNQAGVTRWVYLSSGEKDANGEATPRKKVNVVSNYNGSNLDPCSVKRHNHHLKKLGFANNLHAKGLF